MVFVRKHRIIELRNFIVLSLSFVWFKDFYKILSRYFVVAWGNFVNSWMVCQWINRSREFDFISCLYIFFYSNPNHVSPIKIINWNKVIWFFFFCWGGYQVQSYYMQFHDGSHGLREGMSKLVCFGWWEQERKEMTRLERTWKLIC